MSCSYAGQFALNKSVSHDNLHVQEMYGVYTSSISFFNENYFKFIEQENRQTILNKKLLMLLKDLNYITDDCENQMRALVAKGACIDTYTAQRLWCEALYNYKTLLATLMIELGLLATQSYGDTADMPYSLFFEAIECNRSDIVQAFITAGIDVNAVAYPSPQWLKDHLLHAAERFDYYTFKAYFRAFYIFGGDFQNNELLLIDDELKNLQAMVAYLSKDVKEGSALFCMINRFKSEHGLWASVNYRTEVSEERRKVTKEWQYKNPQLHFNAFWTHPTYKNYFDTALILAAKRMNAEILQMLFVAGAYMSAEDFTDGQNIFNLHVNDDELAEGFQEQSFAILQVLLSAHAEFQKKLQSELKKILAQTNLAGCAQDIANMVAEYASPLHEEIEIITE